MPTTPPPIPTASQKKSMGCFGWFILIMAGAFAVIAVIGFVAPSAMDSRPSETVAEPPTNSETPKPSDVQQTVPEMVARVAKEELGPERYKESSAAWDDEGKGWLIMIWGLAGSRGDHPKLLQKEMIELAARCHPAGMNVSRLRIIYSSDFNDGLGNSSENKLVQCEMKPGIAGKINWGDRGLDLYALQFNRIFETKFCHPSFKKEWEKVDQ